MLARGGDLAQPARSIFVSDLAFDQMPQTQQKRWVW
jgi:hypothetical protein